MIEIIESLDLSVAVDMEDSILVSVNDKAYTYKPKEDSEYTIPELVDLVNKIRKYAPRRALDILKKNADGTHYENPV